MWGNIEVLRTAVARLEEKGYEVRQVRLTVQDHGHKTLVVLYLSPAPDKGLSTVRFYGAQNVGQTARRNIETLLAYVDSLSEVQHAGT